MAAPAVRAAAIYLLLTLAMTWPLAAGLGRDVPGDLGDSLLNLWILGWGAEHLPDVVAGRMSWRGFWDANIFHPEPLALGLSEHLVGQVIQILPVYQLTGNLILAYNLLFLASFVLSGLGMYLLVRDLLGGGPAAGRAAFVAGLVFAFLPMRIAQVAHIQSVSSQWMPLALYGFRRAVVAWPAGGPRAVAFLRPLAGGSAALLMQHWSSGYYLIFFAPMVLLFVAHQIVASGHGRDWRLWAAFAAAGALVAAGTWPFLAMYLATSSVHDLERPFGEVVRFSADVYSYATAPEALRLWGGVMQAYPKPEGELFPGLVAIALVAVSLAALPGLGGARLARPRSLRAWATVALAVLVGVQVAGLVGILATGGFVTSLAGVPVRATNAPRLLGGIALAALLLLAVSPSARERARRLAGSALAFALAAAILGWWLSLGPVPQSMGRPLAGLGIYAPLADWVPGFDSLRVPARYAMVAAVFASVAAGFGAFVLLARTAAPGRWAVGLAAAILLESAFVPMPVNQTWGDGGVVPPPRVEPSTDAPPIYDAVAALPPAAVIAEFPFGDAAWDLRAVYYSTAHWRRLVNGYSGDFPLGSRVRAALLGRPSARPDRAWDALREAGTTHVVVHHEALPPGEAAAIEAWLTARGARVAARAGADTLLALPE